MSFKERVIDGVSGLFERLSDGEAISGVDPAELETELAHRREHYKSSGKTPRDSKRAKAAQTGQRALAYRTKLAVTRLKRIHAKQEKAAAAQRIKDDAAFHRMAEEARQNPAPPRQRPSPNTQAPPRTGKYSRQSSSRRPATFKKDSLAAHYKTLHVDYGADAKTVKKAYRTLMRKFHPDLHQDPKKKKAATTLTVKISAAFAAIEAHQAK